MDILQIYLNHKLYPFLIKEQKFIATIFAIVISLAQFITDISSEQSVYMSLPYLAPAIFIIGAVLLFVEPLSYLKSNTCLYCEKLKDLSPLVQLL